MRTIKTLRPIDYAIRGAFLGAMLVGGMFELPRQRGASEASLAGSPAQQCRQHARDAWWAEVVPLGC